MLFWRAINPSLGGDSLEMLRQIRELAGYSQQELANKSGVSQHTISEIELGRRKPQGRTLRKLAEVLGVEVADLLGGSRPPLGPAATSQQPALDGALDEERRTAWESAVEEARRLRETGRAQMWKALSEWRASKQRGEPEAIRDKHLDEMGGLLKEAYDAQEAVGGAYMQATLKQNSYAPLPAYLREESGAATDFYLDLWRLVQDAGLSIRTSSKQAGEQAGEQAEPEKRPTRIEEIAA